VIGFLFGCLVDWWLHAKLEPVRPFHFRFKRGVGMFQQLFAMLQDGDVFLLTLTREGDDLRVNLIPKGTEASSTAALLPLSIHATPTELDDPAQGFASAIQHYGEVRHGVLEAIREVEAAGKAAVASAKKPTGGKPSKSVETKDAKPATEPVRAPWAQPQASTPPAPASTGESAPDDEQNGLFSSQSASASAPAPDTSARRATLEHELETLRARLETNATMLGMTNAFTEGVLNQQLAAFPLGQEYSAKCAELESLGGVRVIPNSQPEWPATGNTNPQEEAA
jgi:PRTRC genetic system protein E